MFTYNRSATYVEQVLAIARAYTATATRVAGTGGPGSRLVADAAIAYAMSQLGQPYLWGGDGPEAGEAGFDCSGLTAAAYGAADIQLPRTAHTQYHAGSAVPPGTPLLPGDLVFYGTADHVHHVGLYIGNGQHDQRPTPRPTCTDRPLPTPRLPRRHPPHNGPTTRSWDHPMSQGRNSPSRGDSRSWISDDERATIAAAIAALRPMTEQQIAAVCEVINLCANDNAHKTADKNKQPSVSRHNADQQSAVLPPANDHHKKDHTPQKPSMNHHLQNQGRYLPPVLCRKPSPVHGFSSRAIGVRL